MLFRKFVLFAVATLALGCSAAAHAQIGLYATVIGERINGITCTEQANNCASNDGAVRPYGANFGAFYEFRSYGPARIGFDLRGGVVNANKSANSYQASTDLIRHYSALGGAHASFGTRYKFLRPYVAAEAGFARTDAAVAPTFQNYTQVQARAGLDVPLFQQLDLRAIEFTAGEMFGPSSHSTQSIGIGLVFHTTR